MIPKVQMEVKLHVAWFLKKMNMYFFVLKIQKKDVNTKRKFAATNRTID